MFSNAKNTVINGGTFTMQGDFHIHRILNDGGKCEPTIQDIRQNTDRSS